MHIGERHHLCRACNITRVQSQVPQSTNETKKSTSTNEIQPLFNRTDYNLSIIQRCAMILLHLQGKTPRLICESIPCNVDTVYH